MKKSFLTILMLSLAIVQAVAQTLNVEVGNVIYQFPAADAGTMKYVDGTSLTIENKTFAISDITRMYVDATEVDSTTVTVAYDGTAAKVYVAGDIAHLVTPTVSGAHVSIVQSDDVDNEITYSLSGTSTDGEFYMKGTYKATVELRGLTLTNATPVYSGAAICIMDGKRIELSVKAGTTNTLTDCASPSDALAQKAAVYCKGHLELKGQGTLTVNGLYAHAIKSAEYMTLRKASVNVASAVKDGISCDEYFAMESGSLTIKGTGDDALQCDIDGTTSTGATTDHDGEDSGNIYLTGGTVDLTVTADAAKGIKAGGDFQMSGGTLTVTQTGSIVADTDISYPTSVKTDGNIAITGGTVTIKNTADGGKGLSAEGTLTIDESAATTVIDITANGKGGTAETTGSSDEETTQSYKVYVTLPSSSGGGQGGFGGQGGQGTWTTLYLYKSDGTLVQQLTSTVTKSNTTFYYYDFGASDSGTYYFKSADYSGRSGWGGSSSTYSIVSQTFTGPTSGSDVYYQITNSYSTSGTTRTYKLTNVTSTYSGTDDTAEENGTGYNAIGLKADEALTISGGTVKVSNSGQMSKSIKSKATVTINGGDITLKPSGSMLVINNDASYSIGVKAVDFVQTDGTLTITASGQAGRGISATNITTDGGTLTITNSGAGVQGSTDDYTAKGLKANTAIKLNAGNITITMSGTGGKGIKSKGTFTEGTSDGNGPTLKVTTTGSKLGGSTGGGGGWGPGQQTSGGGSAKGIKVQGTITLYGGTTEVYTSSDGAEGLESKTKSTTSIVIKGGQHYFKTYDDCINSAGCIVFDGGATVCYAYGNDAVDSNYGSAGAITIGNGAVMAYTTKGSPEEGLDCDNDSYIKITGTGYAISAGAQQGGGGGWGGSSSSSLGSATQGYGILSTPSTYSNSTYYTLADASGNNLMTYKFDATVSNSHSIITAKGMVKGSSYTIKSGTTAPTDATTAWHGLYLGSSAKGSTQVASFTAQ